MRKEGEERKSEGEMRIGWRGGEEKAERRRKKSRGAGLY